MIWTDEICAYVESPTFEARCCELFGRIDAGEWFTLAAAAEVVGLPWPIFRDVFATYLVGTAAAGAVRRSAVH
jgi:hypothetical protein